MLDCDGMSVGNLENDAEVQLVGYINNAGAKARHARSWGETGSSHHHITYLISISPSITRCFIPSFVTCEYIVVNWKITIFTFYFLLSDMR